MPKFDDITGLRSGKLVALSRVPNDGHHHTHLLCQCDCGNTKIIDGSSIRSGKTKSCGCWSTTLCHTVEINRKRSDTRNAKKKFPEEVAFSKLFYTYRKNAQTRGLSWSITKDEFKKLTKQNCYYCNAEPKNIMSDRVIAPYPSFPYTYNGLDRVNNSSGYAIDNVVTCCRRCNVAKHDVSLDDFINMARRIVFKFGTL